MAVDRISQTEPRRILVDKAVPAPVPAVVQQQQPLVLQQQQPQQPVIVERAFKQTTTKRRIENDSSDSRSLLKIEIFC